MVKNRNQEGRFTPEHTDGEVLAAVRSHEPAATSEVAEELGVSRQGADHRLRRLREAGKVNSKKIGASLVWFTPDPDAGSDDGADHRDAAGGEEPDRPDTSPPPANATEPSPDAPERSDTSPEEPVDASSDALSAVVDTVAEEWEDTDERLTARKAAASAVLEYAREHGTVSKQEAKEELFPEYPVEGQNARTWYRKNIRPVLNEAAEYDQSARAYRLDLGGDP